MRFGGQGQGRCHLRRRLLLTVPDRMYRKGLEGGKDLSGNYKSFANSRAYRRYQTTSFYKKAIESMYDMARLMDGEEKKALYEQARKTKEMMINELDKIGDE